MKLWICEKPNVARALANALDRSPVSKTGYIEIDGGKQIISWCIGHLLSTLMPSEYDSKYKSWDISLLPFVPKDWKLKVTEKDYIIKQAKVLAGLIGKADEIVNAGDADREGQLLVDEFIAYCGAEHKPITRCLINDMNLDQIRKAAKLSEKQLNKNFRPLLLSALGRQRADFLIGINNTMCVTNLARHHNFYNVLSVGRVQTPSLRLIVDRDLEIENFKPKDYFNIRAVFEKDNVKFNAVWLPKGISEALLKQTERIDKAENASDDDEEITTENIAVKGFDEDGRLIDPVLAQAIYEKIKQAGVGKVVSYAKMENKRRRPNLFNLSDLRKELGQHGIKIKEADEIIQSLYEKGYITYPRAESRLLSMAMKKEVPMILNNAKDLPFINATLHKQLDMRYSTAIWDEKGEDTQAHHAIIITNKIPVLENLTETHRKTYEIVARRTLIHFLPDCEYEQAKIQVEIAEELFEIKGEVTTKQGWAEIQLVKNNKDAQELPYIPEGALVNLDSVENIPMKTTPKSLFLESAFPSVMADVYKLITDKELRRKIKALGGLGTEATRGNVLATLKDRGYVTTVRKSGKEYLTSTELGKTLIQILPKELSSVEMTVEWESYLKEIEKGTKDFDEFMTQQAQIVHQFINVLKTIDFSPLAKLPEEVRGKSKSSVQESNELCPKCQGKLLIQTVKKEGPSKGKKFLSCSNWKIKNCNYTKWL